VAVNVIPQVKVHRLNFSIVYLGCYKDKGGDRVLPTYVSSARDKKSCAIAASKRGAKYFGLQCPGCNDGPQCFVGSTDYRRKGETTGCKNGLGGFDKNSIYKLDELDDDHRKELETQGYNLTKLTNFTDSTLIPNSTFDNNMSNWTNASDFNDSTIVPNATFDNSTNWTNSTNLTDSTIMPNSTFDNFSNLTNNTDSTMMPNSTFENQSNVTNSTPASDSSLPKPTPTPEETPAAAFCDNPEGC
jgi:hypothetical protein